MSSCLAATSMPRVGSSRISTRGCVASQRAMIAFCWLPPESWPIGVSMLAVLMPSAATSFSAICRCSADLEELREAHARLQRQRDVLAHREVGDDAAVLAVFGAEAEAESQRVRGIVELRRLAVDAGSRRRRARRARTAAARARCGRSLTSRRARALRRRLSSRSMGLSWPRRGDVRAPRARAAPRRRRRHARVAAVLVAAASSRPTMAATSPCASSLRAGVFADELAVAQHGHAIADLVDLVEEMRDEQDRDALVAQPADEREQRLHFVGIEARGGLVEDQHARVGGRRRAPRWRAAAGRRAGRRRAASRRGRCRGRRATRAARRSVSRQSMPPPRVQGRRGYRPAQMFSATERFGSRWLSWCTALMPSSCACSGECGVDRPCRVVRCCRRRARTRRSAP